MVNFHELAHLLTLYARPKSTIERTGNKFIGIFLMSAFLTCILKVCSHSQTTKFNRSIAKNYVCFSLGSLSTGLIMF